MVRITVRPLGPWQMMLGGDTKDVEVSGHTLRDLLETLDRISAGAVKKMVLEEGDGLDPRFKIYVNGTSCDVEGLDTLISEGDSVMLFSVIDGG